MNIGQAAQLTGLSAKTIRYYESVDLVSAHRDQNGYRNFSEREIQQLLFIRRLRNLGFNLSDCQMLVAALATAKQAGLCDEASITTLQSGQGNVTNQVSNGIGQMTPIDTRLRALLLEKLHDIDGKLEELATLRSSIAQSVADIKTRSNGSEFIRLLNRTS